jgi:hypothetical protein
MLLKQNFMKMTEDELRVSRDKFEPVRQANQSHYRKLEKRQQEFVKRSVNENVI